MRTAIDSGESYQFVPMGEKNSAGNEEPWALGSTTEELYEVTERMNSGWRLQLKSDYLDLNPGSFCSVLKQFFNLSVSPMSSSVKRINT